MTTFIMSLADVTFFQNAQNNNDEKIKYCQAGSSFWRFHYLRSGHKKTLWRLTNQNSSSHIFPDVRLLLILI
jgi:hypothetical protein